nr:MAG: hypothetical protein [Cressdnaviricota sp.]
MSGPFDDDKKIFESFTNQPGGSNLANSMMGALGTGLFQFAKNYNKKDTKMSELGDPNPNFTRIKKERAKKFVNERQMIANKIYSQLDNKDELMLDLKSFDVTTDYASDYWKNHGVVYPNYVNCYEITKFGINYFNGVSYGAMTSYDIKNQGFHPGMILLNPVKTGLAFWNRKGITTYGEMLNVTCCVTLDTAVKNYCSIRYLIVLDQFGKEPPTLGDILSDYGLEHRAAYIEKTALGVLSDKILYNIGGLNAASCGFNAMHNIVTRDRYTIICDKVISLDSAKSLRYVIKERVNLRGYKSTYNDDYLTNFVGDHYYFCEVDNVTQGAIYFIIFADNLASSFSSFHSRYRFYDG